MLSLGRREEERSLQQRQGPMTSDGGTEHPGEAQTLPSPPQTEQWPGRGPSSATASCLGVCWLPALLPCPAPVPGSAHCIRSLHTDPTRPWGPSDGPPGLSGIAEGSRLTGRDGAADTKKQEEGSWRGAPCWVGAEKAAVGHPMLAKEPLWMDCLWRDCPQQPWPRCTFPCMQRIPGSLWTPGAPGALGSSACS